MSLQELSQALQIDELEMSFRRRVINDLRLRKRDVSEDIGSGIFTSFLAGKIDASKEIGEPHSTLTRSDLDRIEMLRRTYMRDYDAILHDTERAISKPKEYRRRAEALGQMGAWTAYNDGKLSTFDLAWGTGVGVGIGIGLQEARRRFLVAWVCQVDACPECRPYCGDIYRSAMEIRIRPPLHINCRCRLRGRRI